MIVSTDINGDTKPDLISASFDRGTIGILLGKGDGGFNQPVNLPVFDTLLASLDVIATGDFDQDGAIDLESGGDSRNRAESERWKADCAKSFSP